MKSRWLLCALGLLLLNPISALDVEAAQRGSRLRVANNDLARDHERLFQTDIFYSVPVLLHRMVEDYGDAGLTALASRLLQPTPREVALAARQQDERVKLAVLRELRFRTHPAAADLYALVVAQERSSAVVRMALLDGFRVAPERFTEHALRLAVAGARNAHPAAMDAANRRFAVATLVEQSGPNHPDTITALRHAISDDHFVLCLAALELIPVGQQPGLSAVALGRVLGPVAAGERGIVWSIAMAALRRCRLSAQHPLAGQLLDLALNGEADVAHAVLAAVRAGRVESSPEHAARWRARARRVDTPAALRLAIYDALITARAAVPVDDEAAEWAAIARWREQVRALEARVEGAPDAQ